MDNIAGQSLLEPLSDATHRNSAHDPWAVTFYDDGLNRIDPNLCRGDRWHDQSATASRKFFGIWVFLPGPDIISLYRRRHYGLLGVSPSALMVAAGAVLILASLQGLLGWGTSSPKSLPRAELQLGVSPIAFPTMIRPYGIGVLIIFVSYFPSLENKLSILSISIAIMVLNLGAMFVSHRVMAAIGTVPLTILGSVFS
ncbi:MAG: hypothetical protein ACK5PF_04885, partial [bacterium]